jgi:hypothetical protein
MNGRAQVAPEPDFVAKEDAGLQKSGTSNSKAIGKGEARHYGMSEESAAR